jgi:hypothetical protein
MEFREDNESKVITPQLLVALVRDAHQFFEQHNIDETYQTITLDLIRRYIVQEGPPREPDPFFGAALYMVSRHPWSHPNPLTKTEFSAKLLMKESSLEWYTDTIAEKLGFIVLHDRNQLPFFVDPDGTIANVIVSVVRSSVGEEVVKTIVTGSSTPTADLAERIVDRLCNIVRVVPSAFEQDLLKHVQRNIEEESNRMMAQFGTH